MRKLIIVLLLFIGSFAQAQTPRMTTVRPSVSYLIDSVLGSRYSLHIVADSLITLQGEVYFPRLVYSKSIIADTIKGRSNLVFDVPYDTVSESVRDSIVLIPPLSVYNHTIFKDSVQFKDLILGEGIRVTANITAGDFSGSGTNLVDLDANNIGLGTLDDARLSSNVPLLDAANVFTNRNNTFKSIRLTSGSDDTIKTTDNFALWLGVNNSMKMKIANNGIFNYYSGVHNYTNGSNIELGTTDDYNLAFKTRDSTRISITNRGDLILPTLALAGNKYGVIYRGSQRFQHFYYGGAGTSTNFFFGLDAGNFTSTANNNYGIGESALAGLTTGVYNFGAGYKALIFNNSGSYNFVLGMNSAQGLTTASYNTIVGNWAGNKLNVVGTADYNVFISSFAGAYCRGNRNILFGMRTGEGLNTAASPFNDVIAIGFQAGRYIYNGEKNLYLGTQSGYNDSTGSGNIALGYRSFYTNVSGSLNIIVGGDLDTRTPTSSKELNIGNGIYGTELYTDTTKIGVNIDSPTSMMHVNGSFSTNFVNKTTSYYLTNKDHTVNFTSGNDTAFLVNATACIGREVIVKNSGAGSCFVKGIVSQTIDEASIYALPTKFDWVVLRSDGANWIITGKGN